MRTEIRLWNTGCASIVEAIDQFAAGGPPGDERNIIVIGFVIVLLQFFFLVSNWGRPSYHLAMPRRGDWTGKVAPLAVTTRLQARRLAK